MSENFQKCIEVVTNEFTSGDYFREVYEAKKEYFDELGTISEDDPDFENQMDLFMGWYLFDRPLNKHELPPVILYFRKNQTTLPDAELETFRALTETRHSVFELLKQKSDGLYLRDVGNGKKFEVEETKFRAGFSKGDLFEARLIPNSGKYLFASGFCFHPKEATKFIESQMKKIREEDHAQRTKLLRKLGQMKNKHLRFPHIDVQYIYTMNPKF